MAGDVRRTEIDTNAWLIIGEGATKDEMQVSCAWMKARPEDCVEVER